MNLFLLLLAFAGHGLLMAAIVNRIHAFGMPRWLVKSLTAGLFLWTLAAPAAAAWRLAAVGYNLEAWFASAGAAARIAALGYLGACWTFAALMLCVWTIRALWRIEPSVLRSHRVRPVAIDSEAAALAAHEIDHHYLVHLPGNEILGLDLSERAIDVPRLPKALDGLVIVHISDLHFTGHVGMAYFREVVRISNELKPDLVAITGDLVDKPQYIDWLPETLGKLEARHGVYFVLGNHDLKSQPDATRRVLSRCGLVDLGGCFREIEIRGIRVLLAGNELPWFIPAADMKGATPRCHGGALLRIALCHSPDQLDWAVAYDFDLLLAGHTHGGQIRFPFIGPLLSPSLSGVKYASGLFYRPPTIMHVTRGVSGELPVRLGCPPEMAKLTLHAGEE